MTSTREVVLRAEALMGGLTPYSSERVMDAIERYGEQAVLDAIEVAGQNDAQSWAYVAAVLGRARRATQGTSYQKKPTAETMQRMDDIGAFWAYVASERLDIRPGPGAREAFIEWQAKRDGAS